MRQLSLLLEHRRLLGRQDFLVSPCNVEAVEWIDLYPDWGNNFSIVILGPKSSGKTHLSWLFSEKTGAKIYDASELSDELFSDIVPINSSLVIENIDEIIGDFDSEENLFHIINYAQECNTKLLLTSEKNFSTLTFKIMDLKTRLQSFPVANIYAPDDEFLKSLLVKQFLERDIIVAPDVIEYIVKHIPRDTVSVKYVVEQADLLSFEEKHRITVPFIKKIIEKFEKPE
ncbi:MAG: hypothetical protein IJ638_04060 [Alphaproteobacteria bacterium]|nr:hypothetical protein [Alphaproteobacteria bacterium]